MKNELIEQRRSYEEDEIDLFEILKILIKEKKLIISTFLIILFLSLGYGLYEKKIKKEARIIISLNLNDKNFYNGQKFNKAKLLPIVVLDKIYIDNDIRTKNNLTLDEFKNKFKIQPIIPKDILNNKELVNKYIPSNYDIGIRVGNIEESKDILEDYYRYLNDNYMNIYATKYVFKKLDYKILSDKNYSYQDNINLLKKENLFLEKTIKTRLKESISSESTRFEYKKLEIALKNLQDINIYGLENYLEVSGIVKNIYNFNKEYKNKERKLLESISLEEERSSNYKNILENYNKKENNIKIPKNFNIKINNEEKETYYNELLKKYLYSQNKLKNTKIKLLVLQDKNKNLQKMNETEKNYIENELLLMYKDYNLIIDKINLLESKENLINNGQMIKMIIPVQIESYSKWKLIVGVGSVLGLFLGILFAFIKNFIDSFKKSAHILIIFILLGSISYSSQENVLKIQFIGNKFSRGLNLDKTLFIKDKIIKEDFILKKYKLSDKEIKNIKIIPISPANIYKDTKESIINGAKIEYFPTEYLVKLNLNDKILENKIYEDLKENFVNNYNKYYIDNQVKIEKINYIKKYKNYKELIVAFNNIINGLENEVTDYKNSNINYKDRLEYNNILLEIKNLKVTKLSGIENYIDSNKLSLSVEKTKSLLKGQEIFLNREISFLKKDIDVYKKLLNHLEINKNELVLQNNGELVLNEQNGIDNKNYTYLIAKYLEILNLKKELEINLNEINEKYSLIKEPTILEKKIIEEKFTNLEDSINQIILEIENLQYKKHKREKNIIRVI